jgi:23S rRNA (adenine2503-C2)-methyltransferase
MRIADLRHSLQDQGARAIHVQRVLRLWLQALPQDDGPRRLQDFMPSRLLAALPAINEALAGLVRLRSRHEAADGSVRLLLDLLDGQSVESVLLPRGGLCVSAQVGCAVGCVFCMTGQDGLLRQLGSAEIVAQVALARNLRPVRKVVFMGMGEPAHNLDNVLDAIELLGTLGNIGHKSLVFSSVGDLRLFERLPRGKVRPALALSLHTTRDELRGRLLPRAPRIPVVELVERAEQYARATGYPIQYQWTLLQGINDGPDEVAGLVRLLKGRYAVLNLIPYNAVDSLPFRRPAAEHARAMAQELSCAGVLTKLRQSAGQDVEGGCGQLRARSKPGVAARPLVFRQPARTRSAY